MLVTYLRVNLLLPVIYEIRHRHGIRWTWVEPIWQLSWCVGLGNFLTSLNLKAFNAILINGLMGGGVERMLLIVIQIDVSMLLTDTISEKSPILSLFVTLNVLVPLPRTVILKAVCPLLFLLSHTLYLSFSFLFWLSLIKSPSTILPRADFWNKYLYLSFFL